LFTIENKIRQNVFEFILFVYLKKRRRITKRINRIQENFTVMGEKKKREKKTTIEQQNMLLFNECYPNPERSRQNENKERKKTEN